jgi:catechol-2,3-dioxygenase
MEVNLDTIIFYVHNVDALKTFYNKILGLEVVENDESVWALLRAGSGYVGLHKIGDQYFEKINAGYKFDNNAKIVFEVQGNIAEIRQSLIEQNIPMREIKTFDNYDYWLCDGEDPEGNVFQLKQKKNQQEPDKVYRSF